MQKMSQSGKSHKKLKIVFGVIALLIAGFFIYKYTYIHMERRKHDQASVAINKVADDLSAQGIETRAYKSCQRAQVKFGKGFLTCSTGIIYDGNDSVLSVKEPLEKFISFIENWDFRPSGTADELNPTRHPIVVGTLNYVLYESPLRCGLSYDKVDDSSAPYTLSFGCSKYSKFAIF